MEDLLMCIRPMTRPFLSCIAHPGGSIAEQMKTSIVASVATRGEVRSTVERRDEEL
ncbi:hypothetical protein WMF45_31985 [Sorangium sp. So ce448]|uniref:hypothetical protein n=1 Tax=Sorangium sp. So ce448 TaxID=3133314 RepID=UPI003F5E8482